mgnify:CR=1 FL=1
MSPKAEPEKVMATIPERCFHCHWGNRTDLDDDMYWFRCRRKNHPTAECKDYREVKDGQNRTG